jgi:hypothetical protein
MQFEQTPPNQQSKNMWKNNITLVLVHTYYMIVKEFVKMWSAEDDRGISYFEPPCDIVKKIALVS